MKTQPSTSVSTPEKESDRTQKLFKSARDASVRQFVMVSLLAGVAAAVMTLSCAGPGPSPLVTMLQLHE